MTGEYRAKQMAIFENGEYVVTIAAKDDGEYDEAAEPVIPPGLLDDSGNTVDAATHFTLADGVYSAGLRNGMPEAVIREAIQLVGRLVDLRSPLQADESMRVLFEHDFRDKAKSTGKVVYVGLRGGGRRGRLLFLRGQRRLLSLLRSKGRRRAEGRRTQSEGAAGESRQ